jgi:pimeloyl-ACP methyl ester carboxylesterase
MAAIETLPGRLTHYDIAGDRDAPAVLLIAGGGEHRRSWEPTVEGLASTFRVVTFDNRDAGDNVQETEPYSMADMADDAARLLAALDIDRAHVVGISVGGCVAQHVALRHPELVDHLVLVGAAPAIAGLGIPIVPPTSEDWIADPVERKRRLMPGMVARHYYDTRGSQLEDDAARNRGNSITIEGQTRQLAAFAAHDVRHALRDIKAPTLVVTGEFDYPPLVHGAQLLAEGIPHARLLLYPKVSHLPNVEVTEQFNDDLRSFLAS